MLIDNELDAAAQTLITISSQGCGQDPPPPHSPKKVYRAEMIGKKVLVWQLEHKKIHYG